MKPASPDRAIQQGYTQAESALARIAHVNRLSRDIMDIKHYEADFDGGNSITIPISSKKGIIDIEDADASATSLYIWLKNSEIEYAHDKFYIQLTVYCNNSSITPIVIARGFDPDMFLIEVKNLNAAANWTLSYVYYEIVKID
jgi:hypothetical protein